MMYGHEKSDSVIVAVKPTNKAERSAAEPVEPRTGTKGNAGQQSTRQTQSWARVSQALDRIRQLEPSVRFAVTHPRWEPYAGKPHVRFCAGGARQLASLPLPPSDDRSGTFAPVQTTGTRARQLRSIPCAELRSIPCAEPAGGLRRR